MRKTRSQSGLEGIKSGLEDVKMDDSRNNRGNTEPLRAAKASDARPTPLSESTPQIGRPAALDRSSIGPRLRDAREAKGLSLEELGAKLRLRNTILDALERSDFEALPEPVYTAAYLRSYAQAVNLEPQAIVDAYTRAAAPKAPVVSQPRELPRAAPPWIGIAAVIAVALVVIAYLVTSLLRGQPVAVSSTPTAPVTTAPTTGVTPPAPVSVAQPPAAPPSAEPRSVSLSISSQPNGATVFLDGIRVGITPLQAAPVSAGPGRELKIELPGYQTETRTVDLNAASNLSFALRPAPKPAPQASTPASPTAAPNAVTLSFRGSSWIRVLDAKGSVIYEGIPAADARLSFTPPVRVRAGRPDLVNATIGTNTRQLATDPTPATVRLP
jgi:cytoskeleton protein RodZ